MNLNPVWILYAIAGLAALILVVRFGKMLVWGILLIGGIATLVLLASTTRQQAIATQQVATAATLASAGQTTSSVGVTILAVLLVVVLLGAGGVILFQRAKLRRYADEPEGWRQYPPAHSRSRGGWLPGPNANWQQPALPGSGDQFGQMLQELVGLEMLRAMRDMQGGPGREDLARLVNPRYRPYPEEGPYEASYDDDDDTDWF